MGLIFPDDFRQRFTDIFGAGGVEWLATLPERVARWQDRLGVRALRLVPGLSYNLVFFGETLAGAPIVLKAAPDADGLATETAALEAFGSARAAGVIASLPAEGVLLIERLQPGHRLAEVATEREALEVVVSLFGSGWPAPDWPVGDLATYTAAVERAADDPGPLDAGLLRAAGAARRSLLVDPEPVRLLHGDLHYDNILVDGVHGYRLIDPKGVRGQPGFDLGYLVSRVMPLGRDALPLARVVDLRLDVLADRFGLDRARLAAWGFVAAALSVVWTLEDHGAVAADEIQVMRQLAAAAT